MSTHPNRRARKRQATREAISATATRMFIERGFDNVTVEEIAEAADVARMTVFNHFPRKEDLFFDLEDEARSILKNALQSRGCDVAPVAALQRLMHQLVAERRPFASFTPQTMAFVRTVEDSEALKSRARGIRDEFALDLARSLAESVGRPQSDPDAHLAAHMILACWTVAYAEAHSSFSAHEDADQATSVFLGVMNKGFSGVKAAIASTPYT